MQILFYVGNPILHMKKINMWFVLFLTLVTI